MDNILNYYSAEIYLQCKRTDSAYVTKTILIFGRKYEKKFTDYVQKH